MVISLRRYNSERFTMVEYQLVIYEYAAGMPEKRTCAIHRFIGVSLEIVYTRSKFFVVEIHRFSSLRISCPVQAKDHSRYLISHYARRSPNSENMQ